MNNLVMEILISCLILTLLLAFMPLFRGSTDLAVQGALLSFGVQDDEFDTLPPGTLEGIDVAGAIQYYSNHPDIPVHLITSAGSKTYLDTTLETDPFPYDFSFDALFATQLISENLEIQEIYFEQLED